MRTHCQARRPDLTLEDERKKEINIVDIACPAKGKFKTALIPATKRCKSLDNMFQTKFKKVKKT